MDGIANVSKMQQHQVNIQKDIAAGAQQRLQQVNHTDIVKQRQEEDSSATKHITSEDQMKELIDRLNRAISPFNTSLKFGVDMQDIFYVSVIDSQTSKMIRRFPAEEAVGFLPKIQELSGVLFDSKG